MINQELPRYQLPKIIAATIIAVGSTLTAATCATAVTVNISIENLGPEGGGIVTPLWVGFHDGSFDAFDAGALASSGIEHVSEDGLTGLENITSDFPGFDGTSFEGLDDNFPFPLSSSIADLFANSSASKNGGVQSLVFPGNAPVGTSPGLTGTRQITIDGDPSNHRFFNYAAMYFASNDAFVANDKPIEIFDSQGNFIGADLIVRGSQVWDAGTEVNDESTSTIPYSIDSIGAGVAENGTIGPHEGFTPPGSGGILDFRNESFNFSNSDPTTPGYQVARIRITQASENLENSASIPEPSSIGGLLASGGLLLKLRSWIRRSRPKLRA